MIGDPDTDTENDITGDSDSSYKQQSKGNKTKKQPQNLLGAMSYEDALTAIENEQNNASQKSTKAPPNHENIDWSQYMGDEDDGMPSDQEWSVDRHLRLLDEQENELRTGGNLTAGRNEKRSKIDQLRTMQSNLLRVQFDLQEQLLKNAQIAEEEAKVRLQSAEDAKKMAAEEGAERMKLLVSQRMLAELELTQKQREYGAEI